MTIETMFGQVQVPAKPRTIRLKQIRAVYEILTIKEEVNHYLRPFTRYTSPEQVKEAGEIIGVKLLDHIIIGDSYLSFAGQGLL